MKEVLSAIIQETSQRDIEPPTLLIPLTATTRLASVDLSSEIGSLAADIIKSELSMRA